VSNSTQPTPAPAERKTVLIRFPEPLHKQVAEHAQSMSKAMGGARVSFNAAALSLMHSGLKAG
jgi:hypothetical protein